MNPETISFIEAHGTGTLLGDPIEIKALREVFAQYTQRKQFCAIGSVKSNIGHLLRAAGISGLIKVLLAMKNETIPPTINCLKPHSRFHFEESAFYPALQPIAWKETNHFRRAGISSFGFGGTNCHMILEDYNVSNNHYSPSRQPLPEPRFQRKKFWLHPGETFFTEKSNGYLDKVYLSILRQVEIGSLQPQQALSLIEEIGLQEGHEKSI